MKMKTFVLVPVFCTAASAANAQLVTPPNNFGGADNYLMAAVAPTTGTGCGSSENVMGNINVTVLVTEPIVLASSNCSPNGFAFQLNANAPTSITNPGQFAWQQYCMYIQDSGDSTTTVSAHTQLWSLTKGLKFGPPDTPIGQVSGTAAPTIPAGYILNWAINTNSAGNVTGVTYQVVDNEGNALYTPPGLPISVPVPTPISSFELDLVGTSGCESTFQSGAGWIYYGATNAFSPQTQIPACAISTLSGGRGSATTAEQSPNAAYGLLSQSSFTEQVQPFYISNYQWTNSTFSGGILGDSSSPLSLDSWGLNAVTLAPGNFRDLSWLSSIGGPSGLNAEVGACSYTSPDTICILKPEDYHWGLVWGTDATNLFQWNQEGGVYINNVWTGWGPKGDGGWYTSVAPVTNQDMFLTNTNDGSCGSSTPGGPCIYSAAQGSTPAKWHFGGIQVAVDSRQVNPDLFAIDETTNTVYEITTASDPKATALTTAICGGGTLVADQIAVKGGVVFAIQDNGGQGGIVYAYTPNASPACFDGSDGWTQVGTHSDFLSIATDLVAGQSGANYSDGCSVWATDTNDNAWCACYGSGSCTAPFPVQP